MGLTSLSMEKFEEATTSAIDASLGPSGAEVALVGGPTLGAASWQFRFFLQQWVADETDASAIATDAYTPVGLASLEDKNPYQEELYTGPVVVYREN